MIIFFLWLVFIATHLLSITSIPIFEDEAIYLLLAEQINKNPWNNFFIYLQYGLLPMYSWFIALFNIFFEDSLIAGRILNTLLASTLILWLVKLGKLYKMPPLFSWIGASILITSPILLLNTRVALLDTLILVSTSWYLYFTAQSLATSSPKSLFGLFISLFVAFLTKATALFGISAAVFLMINDFQKHRQPPPRYLKILIIYFVSFFSLGALFFIQGQHVQEDSSSSLVSNLSFIKALAKIKENIFLTFHWIKIYYLPYFILPIIYLAFQKKLQKNNLYILMSIWFLSSLSIMIIFNRFYYPRHTLMLIAPLAVITTSLLLNIPRKIAILFFLSILLIQSHLSWSILTDVSRANVALEDKFIYFENYTSGKEIPNIATTIRQLSKRQPVTVWLDGSYVIEYGLRREMKKDQVNFKSFRLGDNFVERTPIEVIKDPEIVTFVVTNRFNPPNFPQLKLVQSFDVSFRHTQKLYTIP